MKPFEYYSTKTPAEACEILARYNDDARAVAGGYGDPAEHDPQKVLDDVLDDFISLESAREAYGVVIDPHTWTVDEAATEQRRARMRLTGAPPVWTFD